jgi:D-amino-acid dehydrogenase
MRIVVVGAGLIGVTSAWYLQAAGHEVTVVERQPGPALETSLANGGQISVSHAEPWANPRTPLKVLRWLGHEDAPLLWRLRADASQWLWGLRFLGQCRASCTRANISALVALGLYSRTCLQALRTELGLEYDQLSRGILHFYTKQRDFEHALPQAALMTSAGCQRIVKSAAECVAIEPALAGARFPVVGGVFTPDDESGDAYKFVGQLAAHCTGRGVEFHYGLEAKALHVTDGRIAGVALAGGEVLKPDAVVVACGSYSTRLLHRLGLRIPVIPAKGYSITIPLEEEAPAPFVSLTDDECKLVISRLGNRLRVAGTAEFSGYDTTVSPARCAAIVRRVHDLFPQLSLDRGVELWAGLRPATPGNVPLIGKCRVPNLFVNTGHGTLGWTLACGSGRLLADQVSGRMPDIAAAPYAIQ